MSGIDEMLKDVLKDVRDLLEYQATLGLTEVPILNASTLTSASTSSSASTSTLIPPPPLVDPVAAAKALEALRAEIGDCQRCRLGKGRTKLAFGLGNPCAEVMFIGEGPGRDEDLQGEPFVGAAGQLLTKIIEAMGFRRDEVYIANIVKCLRYNAMVQLGDGTWERIGRLVRQRYQGMVRTVDKHGYLVNRRVVGWHETPLANRSVYRLTYKSARHAGTHKCAIQLTGDHPVMTERGYIEVAQLKTHDRIATGQGVSPTLQNVIYGMLLGDGHLAARRAGLSFSHSAKQETYAIFKKTLLDKTFDCTFERRSVIAGGEKRYPIVRCWTNAHRALHVIRRDFYQGRTKRVPPVLATNLNPMMLAIWFMDDGYMRIRPPRKPSAEIATCAFSLHDIRILLQGLFKLGIKASTRRHRIFFDTASTIKLSKVIAPYVPPSMRWKLHPEIAAKIPYDPGLYRNKSKPIVLYDDVELEQINFKGTDKTFFCIDVEETHNFVTTGGVVHNCRPPNNRNPEADEAATCMPFLIRQVEIVQPKVIVCLGSVAVQNLLATERKITSLRGKWQKWRGIPVMPTFHPAFLLRNAAMKKPVWEDMQQVLTRLGRTPPSR